MGWGTLGGHCPLEARVAVDRVSWVGPSAGWGGAMAFRSSIAQGRVPSQGNPLRCGHCDGRGNRGILGQTGMRLPAHRAPPGGSRGGSTEVCTHTLTHSCTHARTRSHTLICTCSLTHAHIRTHIHTHSHRHTHAHTPTHTRTHALTHARTRAPADAGLGARGSMQPVCSGTCTRQVL